MTPTNPDPRRQLLARLLADLPLPPSADPLAQPITVLIPDPARAARGWLKLWPFSHLGLGAGALIETPPTWLPELAHLANRPTTLADLTALWPASPVTIVPAKWLPPGALRPAPPPPGYTLRPLTAADQPAYHTFYATCGDSVTDTHLRWGLPHTAALWRGTDLACVAALYLWHDLWSVVVATHPAHVNRGLARAAVSALCAEPPDARPITYRYFADNHPSARVATILGFEDWFTTYNLPRPT